jgi:hypothetical protein
MVPKDRNKKGTGFTNIGRILEASRGARLGGQVTSGVQQTGQQVRSQIGQAAGQFQEQAKKASEGFGQQAAAQRDETIQQLGAVTPSSGTGGLGQAGDPVSQIQNWATTEYRGPTELEDYGSLAGRVSEAEQIGRLGRTTGGKQELLRRFVGGRDYSQGQQTMDAALLGLTGSKELSEARKATRGLGGELIREAGGASEQARQLATQAAGFGEDTIKRVEGTRDKILTDAEYGAGGKSLDQLFKESQAKEKARGDLASEIRDFDSKFEGLVQSGLKTRDEKRETFQDLIKEAQESGYIDNSEVAQLFLTRSTLDGQSFNPEYDFISRAEQAGLNPYADLAALVSGGRAAQNVDIGGFVAAQDPNRASQLSLLERALNVSRDQAQFSPDREAYESGTLGFEQGTIPLRLNVLDKEIKNLERPEYRKNVIIQTGDLLNNNRASNREENSDSRYQDAINAGRLGNALIFRITERLQKGIPLDRNQLKRFNYRNGGTETYDITNAQWQNILKAFTPYTQYTDRLQKSKNYKQQLIQQQARLNNPYADSE